MNFDNPPETTDDPTESYLYANPSDAGMLASGTRVRIDIFAQDNTTDPLKTGMVPSGYLSHQRIEFVFQRP